MLCERYSNALVPDVILCVDALPRRVAGGEAKYVAYTPTNYASSNRTIVYYNTADVQM
jgi:hypothetical protein